MSDPNLPTDRPGVCAVRPVRAGIDARPGFRPLLASGAVQDCVMALSYPTPDLEASRVQLRKWSHDDLDCVAEAATDPEIPRGTTVPAQYTEAAGREWIERQWSRQTSGEGLSLAVVDLETGDAVGLVYLGLRRPEGHCELGYWLVPSARGRRLGAEAVRLASRWVLRETDVYRLYAHVVPTNAPSLAVMRACGFTREGVLRSYLRYPDAVFDVVSFSLLDTDLERSGRADR